MNKCNDTYYSDKLCDCLTNVSVRCRSGGGGEQEDVIILLVANLPFRCRLHPKYVIGGGELELGCPLVDALEPLPDTGHDAATAAPSINPKIFSLCYCNPSTRLFFTAMIHTFPSFAFSTNGYRS